MKPAMHKIITIALLIAGTVAAHAAPDAARVAGDLKEDGIHFSADNNVIRKLADLSSPWTISNTDIYFTGGNVGIGTPGLVPLDVNGNANVSGSLSAGSASFTNTVGIGGDATVFGSLSMGSTTRQMLNLWGTIYALGVQNYTLYSRSDGGFAWYKGGTHSTGTNEPGTGGTALMALNSSGYLGLGTATPNRHLHLSRAGGTELNMEMSDGLSGSRVWNFAVYGPAKSAPQLDFRVMNDDGTAVTKTVLSLFSNGRCYT